MSIELTTQFRLLEKKIDNSLKFLNELSTEKKEPKFKFNNVLDYVYASSYIKVHSRTKSGIKYKNALEIRNYIVDKEWIYTKDLLRLMKLEIIIKSTRSNSIVGTHQSYDGKSYIVIDGSYFEEWRRTGNASYLTVDHEMGHAIHHLVSNLTKHSYVYVCKTFYNFFLESHNKKINSSKPSKSIEYFGRKYIRDYAGQNIYEAFACLYEKGCDDLKKGGMTTASETLQKFNRWAIAEIWNKSKKKIS